MTNNVLVIGGDHAERFMLCNAIREKLTYLATDISYETADDDLPSVDELAHYNIILFDISRLPASAEKVAKMKATAPDTPLIVLTRYGDYEGAMASISAGAIDFMTKPVAVERMSITFRNTLILHELQRGNGKPSQPVNHIFSLFSEDGNIRRIYELEKEAIMRAVQFYDGRMSEVARRLGIGRSTLYRKLNEGRIIANKAA